jgi:hypothetical protein
MAKTPDTPHDKLFKRRFSEVENAVPELRAILPPALLERIDLSTLKVVPGEFVDEALKSSHSDLLYEVQLSAKPAFVYVLFEHQSSADPLLALRLMRYLVRILERYARAAKASDDNDHRPLLPLPAVIPVVLHHSETGWTAAQRLEDLFDPQLVADSELTPLIPRLTFVLDDISRLTDEALRKRTLTLVSTLTLWALRDARDPDRLLRTLQVWAWAIVELLRQPGGREAAETLFRYIVLVANISPEVWIQRVYAVIPEAKDAIMTIAEQLQAKGRAEGERTLILRLLTVKFGELSEPARDRVAAASEDDLTRWAERMLSATSLEQVFEDKS